MIPSPLTDILNKLDDAVHTEAPKAIKAVGGRYKDLPVQYFRHAPQDDNLRLNAWIVGYEQINQATERETIGINGVRKTESTLQVTFALPGKQVKDTSQRNTPNFDNWGNTDGLTSPESEIRYEAQTCRAVAHSFALAMDNKQNGVLVTSVTVDEDKPYISSRARVWYPSTVNINWKQWWDHRPQS